MVPTGGQRFVVLDTGWCGEGVLVRLLSAGRATRICGHPLARPVAHPVRRLLRAVTPRDERAAGALVQPHHLWLINGLDPAAAVAELRDAGVRVLSLHRSNSVDRGVSRALCGPRSEVLPAGPHIIDPGHVAVFAKENDYAAPWFDEVVTEPELRLVFERDLLTAEARQATVERVTAAFGLASWEAPAEHDVPSHDALWARVHDGDALLEGLRIIEAVAGG
jgi:hypothetical protein